MQMKNKIQTKDLFISSLKEEDDPDNLMLKKTLFHIFFSNIFSKIRREQKRKNRTQKNKKKEH